MKHLDEYRDGNLVRALREHIAAAAERLERPVALMEICGSHTHAIGRFGLRRLLPEKVRLVSGPGCPVCVTAPEDVEAALFLAERPDTMIATFGDMLRVPGEAGRSLQRFRADGADIRVVFSPTDVPVLARENPDREVVFLGLGFETTAPTAAAMLVRARAQGLKNLSLLSFHKTIPPAISVLLADPELCLDGFLCPGHVSMVTGEAAYAAIPAANRAAVITGFEPTDILEGILMCLEQILHRRFAVEIQYGRGVQHGGNLKAQAVLEEVFMPSDAAWRGLGIIPGSGLSLRPTFAAENAVTRFSLPAFSPPAKNGCRCGEVLRGHLTPEACPLFARGCTPALPVGPCMVSSEGACAAAYRYSAREESL